MYDSAIEYEEYVLYTTEAETNLLKSKTATKIKDILIRIAEKASSLVSKIISKFIALVKKANVVVLMLH